MKSILFSLLAAISALPALAQTHQRVPDFDGDYDNRPKPNPEMLRTPNKAFTQVIIQRPYKGGSMDTSEVFSVRYNAKGLPLEMKEYKYNDDPAANEEPFSRIQTNIAEGSSTEYTYDAQGNVLTQQDYDLMPANSFGAVYTTLILMYQNEMSVYNEDEQLRQKNRQRLLRSVDSLITNGVAEIRTPGDDEHYEYNADGNPLYRYSLQNKNNYRYTYTYDPKNRVSTQKAIYTSTVNGGRPYVSAIQHQFTYTPNGKLWASYTYTSETDTNDFVSNQTLRLQKIFHYNAKGLIDTIDYLHNMKPVRHVITYQDTLQTQYTIAAFNPHITKYVTQSVVYYTYNNNVLTEMKTVSYEDGIPESYEREVYTHGKWDLPTQVLTYSSETGNVKDEWLKKQDLFFYGDKKQDAQIRQLAMTSPREAREPSTRRNTPPPPVIREVTIDEMGMSGDPNGIVEAPPPPQSGEQIFTMVEQMPEYPGGSAAMFKFLADNIHYPEAARENETQGRVVVKFVVRADGNITNVEVVRKLGDGCDEEAVRVIKKMPKWRPGKQNGRAVDVYFTLPITFSLN